MAKSVALLLREAAEALEQQNSQLSNNATATASTSTTTSARSVTNLTATPDRQGSTRAEVMRLFGPYPSARLPLRRHSTPSQPAKKAKRCSYTHRFFCLAGRKDCEVPNMKQKSTLERVGLGEKKISFPDKYCSPEEFSEELLNNFPHLKECGGFQLLRSSGSTRAKHLDAIPCPKEGYSPVHLTSGGATVGQAIIYVRPLQKDINLKNLQEVSSTVGPLIECLYCKEKICLTEMEGHIDLCENKSGENDILSAEESSSNSLRSEDSFVDRQFTTAGTVEERGTERQNRAAESVASSSSFHQPTEVSETEGVSSIHQPPEVSEIEDWKTEPDLITAANMYRRYILKNADNKPDLVMWLDLTSSEEDREREILTFYKRQGVDWTRPFTVNLKGDAAIGDGVKRHFFSLVMEKLQFGFCLDLENVGKTLFFTGMDDHMAPSTSRALVDGDLFQVVGRIIGHSFIHGGPLYTGMSQSFFPLLSAHSEQTPVVGSDDCPDMDVVEIVSLLDNNEELTPQDRQAINTLAFSWDLPPVSDSNRRWLAETILHHGVIGRREKQAKQMRKGLKDTNVFGMIKERPALIEVLFPRAASHIMEPEMILKRVIWPVPDSDDEDAERNLEKSCEVTGFLRDYIQRGSSEELRELLRFWTGWAVLPEHLYVEVSPYQSMPTASTCLTTLKIPLRCRTYDDFAENIKAAVKSTKFGFGLI